MASGLSHVRTFGPLSEGRLQNEPFNPPNVRLAAGELLCTPPCTPSEQKNSRSGGVAVGISREWNVPSARAGVQSVPTRRARRKWAGPGTHAAGGEQTLTKPGNCICAIIVAVALLAR